MSSHPETPSIDPALTRRAPAGSWTTAGLLLVWVACVLLLLFFLEIRPRLATPTPAVATVPTVQAGFPAPPLGAVVFSRELGGDALALGVVSAGDGLLLQASVVGPQGAGVSGLDITFRVSGTGVSARSCGAGCYRALLAGQERAGAIDVVVRGEVTTRWSVQLPEVWPPRNAQALVARAESVWRSLASLSFDETLGSDAYHVVTSSWRVQAPDRLTYRIAGGAAAVIIGDRRWDKAPGGRWQTAPQRPIRQPTPPWVATTNAYVVGTKVTPEGRALVVTFFDPNTPGWFTVLLDRKTLRTLDVRMVATAHFMHDSLHSFDETPVIRPPR